MEGAAAGGQPREVFLAFGRAGNAPISRDPWAGWIESGTQVAYQDVRSAVKLKSLNRGYRTPDPSPTRAEKARRARMNP